MTPMTPVEARIGDREVTPATGWTVEWLDRGEGIARASNGEKGLTLVVEGSGTEWIVTLRGRRIPVTVRTWRERVLAEAEVAAADQAGPIEIRATLPGLVVAIETSDGASVAEGDPLLTIEAMKMQNEVRAPRAGRVESIGVAVGETVGGGQVLLRLE
jgi:acetyl/propionyl-CoA carboxylase alpha subunit